MFDRIFGGSKDAPPPAPVPTRRPAVGPGAARAPIVAAVPRAVTTGPARPPTKITSWDQIPLEHDVLTRGAGGEGARIVLPADMMQEVAVIAVPSAGTDASGWLLMIPGWLSQSGSNMSAMMEVRKRAEKYMKGSPQNCEAPPDVIARLNGVEIKRIQHVSDRASTQKAVQRQDRNARESSPHYKEWMALLNKAVAIDTADVHLEVRFANDPETGEPATRVVLRVDGEIEPVPGLSPNMRDPEFIRAMLAFVWGEMCDNHSETQFSTDLFPSAQMKDIKIAGSMIRGRIQMFDVSGPVSANGEKPFDFVMRILYADRIEIPTLKELGFLPGQVKALERFINGKSQMASVSGKVGSGKSTTLRSLYKMLPPNWKKYAVEDPVEYWHPNTTQIALKDAAAIDKVVKSLKRGDLNALLMGEVRNAETMGLVRNVTFSGHQAFTTTHSESCLGQLPYFLTPEMGMDNFQLSNPAFIGILFHQVLVRKLCKVCAHEGAHARGLLGADLIDTIERKYKVLAGGMRARNADGCETCRAKSKGLASRYGYDGMDVLAEMFVPDYDDLALIEANRLNDLGKQWRAKHVDFDDEDATGKTIQEVGLYKALQGWVDPRSIEAKIRPFADADVFDLELKKFIK